MIFDGTINVVGMDVIEPQADEDGNISEDAVMYLTLTLGMGVPVPQQTPEGIQMVVAPIPAATVRVPLNGEVTRNLISELQTVVDTIPEKEKPVQSESVLIADKHMADQVIAQAAQVEKMRGKK